MKLAGARRRKEDAAMGRNKKYTSAAALGKAVEGYFESISYRTRMKVETEDGARELRVTEWAGRPSVAGLCLHLGISKETWNQYDKDPRLRRVTGEARLRMEEYWTGRLDGKGAHGARFVLTNNFGSSGWKEKVDVNETRVGLSLEEYLEQLEREGGGPRL